MKQICYLLDENVSHAIRDGLLRRRQEMEILAVGHEIAPPLGTLNQEILNWIEREGYILITEDRSTMPQHLYVISSPFLVSDENKSVNTWRQEGISRGFLFCLVNIQLAGLSKIFS